MKGESKYRQIFFIFFIACVLPGGCDSKDKATVIKLAHVLSPEHPVHKAMEFMAQYVAEKSDGHMRIDIYPSRQLGSERELLELLQIGSLGMTKVSAGALEGFIPAFKVMTLPYLFRDDQHRFEVFEGEIGRELLLKGEKYWLRGLCYYDAGYRSFYTKEKPVLKPQDLVGLKVRTVQSFTAINMVNALGGSATPISWGELYTALQQGIVDAAENNPPSFYFSRHYEVCKYYSLDEHTGVPDVLVISTIIWNDLTAQEQEILQQAALASAQKQKVLWREATEKALQEVQKAGVKIYRPNKVPFAEKVQDLYKSYESQPEIYSFIERIRE